MYYTTSVRWHLLRGANAIACVGVALYFGVDHPFIAVVAVPCAIFLMRGCPMCWMFGLVERLRDRVPKVNR